MRQRPFASTAACQPAKQPGVRELDRRGGMPGYFWVAPDGYATRERWQQWIAIAQAYNPRAKTSPRRKRRTPLSMVPDQRDTSWQHA